ncbi:amino acid kinase family protein [Streptomyces tagetis]|uniref:Aspartate/glutamate/uridylate kinase domain-containing protein n=1 Tax=Streptomyces tagetis TaxID=2820809 RepID=A0A941AWT0_9ACTN|nr:hypothetical protein [Streptomyces sp. RG38]MBQ0825159.1 hypothetical protein [Streptomyces sp. RG38]
MPTHTDAPLLILKIGGSLFSDKSRPGSLDEKAFDALVRLVADLHQAHRGRLLLVTGGGAFGHGALRGLDPGDPFAPLPFVDATAGVRWRWVTRLTDRGVRALPLQLGAFSRVDPGDPTGIAACAEPLASLLAAGVLPVLSGDCLIRPDGALEAFSSDRTPEVLIRALGAARVVMLTDVPGLLTGGPGSDRVLGFVDALDPAPAYAHVWKESEWDVSGAMQGKLDALVACARQGADCFIMRGRPDAVDLRVLLTPPAEWPASTPRTRVALPSKEIP